MSPQGHDHGQQPQHPFSNPHHRVPDLVRDSQLNTRFLSGGVTQHTVHVTSNHPSRRRRIRVEETWHRERELGNGTFGRVWLQRCASGPATGSLRAVKEMEKDPSRPVDYTRELEAMAKFSHEKYVHCFVKCHGWYMSENMVFIAMEHLPHGDLQKYLNQPFPEGQAKEIAAQLTEGLVYLHDNGFAHRDLKPANILVHRPGPNWWVKIGDFGISKRAEEENTALRTLIGTEGYLAPEIIGFVFSQDSSSSGSFSYTFAVDMWALGELMFRLIAHRPAFPNRQDLFNCVVRGYPFPISALQAKDVSEDCCDFIMKSMIADPGKRLTAHDATAHIWVQASRPSSRASSASSIMTSEVLTMSSNQPVKNAPSAGTASTSQLKIPFEDTAQWSTGIQESQHQLSAGPFLDTAQWSTGSLEPQQPQVFQQRLSTGTYMQGADGVNLNPRELPNSQRWSGPPTPSLTPQPPSPTQPPGLPETAQHTLDSQGSVTQKVKTLAPGVIQSPSQQPQLVADASSSTEAPATDLFHNRPANPGTGVLMDDTQPLRTSGGTHPIHFDSMVPADDDVYENAEEVLPEARFSSPPVPVAYNPYEPRRGHEYSLPEIEKATMRRRIAIQLATDKVERGKLEVAKAKKAASQAESEAKYWEEKKETDDLDQWSSRQKMRREMLFRQSSKLSDRQTELSVLQSELSRLQSGYKGYQLKCEDEAKKNGYPNAEGHKMPLLRGTDEAQQWNHEQFSPESEGHQRNGPTDVVEYPAFLSFRPELDTSRVGMSPSELKGKPVHSTQDPIRPRGQDPQSKSGNQAEIITDRHSSHESDVTPEGVNATPNHDESRSSTVSTYNPPAARLITPSAASNGESTETAGKGQWALNYSPLDRVSNSFRSLHSSMESSPAPTIPPAPFPPDFTLNLTGPSAIISPTPPIKKSPVSINMPYKLPSYAPPAIFPPDFVPARKPWKPTNEEITAGIARLDRLDHSWQVHIGQDLLGKGLDNLTVRQNYEFIADVLEEMQQMKPYLETPAPPPSPAPETPRNRFVETTAEVARGDMLDNESRSDLANYDRYADLDESDSWGDGVNNQWNYYPDEDPRERRQRNRDSGLRGWFRKKFVP